MTTRVAVIGVGAWGINHVRALATEPRCRLVAVADPDPRTHERVRAIDSSVRHTNDADDILGDDSIDAIVIATPASTHADLACVALEARKHVLVEKPLALDLKSARRVVDAGRRSGRVAMVGHLMLYHPAMIRLCQLLGSGELGRLHYIHSVRANLGRPRCQESVLWSFGPHDLSMIDRLLEGPPDTVSARGQTVVHTELADVVFVTLRYANQTIAHIHLSRLSPRKERRLTLVCSEKLVEFDDVDLEKLRIYERGYSEPPDFTDFAQYLAIRGGDVHIPRIPMEEPLRLELAHFFDCIERGKPPITDVMSGLRTVAILEAAQRSLAADGAPVRLDELA